MNGTRTPSSGVVLLLCYGGIVYQKNSHHSWWLWNANTDRWAASIDPRVISRGGTTIPVATQIIDSGRNVWTLFGGKAYVHGTLTPSSGVILLLYAKGIVYQENSQHDWWSWNNGAWEATSAPLPPSASGTAIPAATEIVDDGRDVWTLSGGKAYVNHAPTYSENVILLLFYSGILYQENVHHDWWEWNGQAWISTTSDPRVGQALAYVASTTGGKNSVTVIDTGTNHVKATIPIGFEASYTVVTRDAKHVYVAGASNNAYGSVAVIDTAQEKVLTSLRVPYAPQGIVASPDQKKVYVVSSPADDQLGPHSTVSTINTATNVVVLALTRRITT
jgi:YVTN family beta-propeller protein